MTTTDLIIQAATAIGSHKIKRELADATFARLQAEIKVLNNPNADPEVIKQVHVYPRGRWTEIALSKP